MRTIPHRTLALALLLTLPPTTPAQDVSTKGLLKDILKEFAKLKAEEMVGRALGRDAAGIVRTAYEIKQAKGDAKKEVRQAFLQALLGPGAPAAPGAAGANPALVSSFQKFLGTAPREDGRPRRGLFRDPAVAQLAGMVVAYSSAKGADKKAVKAQLIDALVPHVTRALGRSRSQTVRGMAEILGGVHELRRSRLAGTTDAPAEPGPAPDEGTGEILPVEPTSDAPVADPAAADPGGDPSAPEATGPIGESPEPEPAPDATDPAAEAADAASVDGEVTAHLAPSAEDQALIDRAVARAIEAQRAEQGGPLSEGQIRAIVLRTFAEARRMGGN